MPRIRDLGINGIPATMRPPEIGDGASGDQERKKPPGQGTVGCSDSTCDDKWDDKDSPSPPDRPTKDAGVLDASAVAQLRRQLDRHIAATFQH